jgi:hypothetical protein
MVVESFDDVASSDAPSLATSAAIVGASRDDVPWSSMAAVKLASPVRSTGLASPPDFSTRLALATGSPGRAW